jgi:hypothetical protein
MSILNPLSKNSIYREGSVIGAHFLLDDLANHLLDTELELPNPYLQVEATPAPTEEAAS